MSEPAVTSDASPEVSPDVSIDLELAPEPQAGAWREGLSEGLRANPAFEKFVDLDGLAKGYVNLEKHVGTDKTSLPQPNWEDKDYDGLYKALGRPDAPEGYDLEDFKPPEGVPWDDKFQERMIGHLHNAGLSQRQVRQVLSGYSEDIAGQFEALERSKVEQGEETTAALRKEWGRAFDERQELARRGFREFAGDSYESLAELELAGGGVLGNHPDVVRMFAKMGAELAEAGVVGPKGGPVGFTPEQASVERARLNADPSFQSALMDRNHPEHDLAVSRMHTLTVAEVGEEEVR